MGLKNLALRHTERHRGRKSDAIPRLADRYRAGARVREPRWCFRVSKKKRTKCISRPRSAWSLRNPLGLEKAYSRRFRARRHHEGRHARITEFYLQGNQ